MKVLLAGAGGQVGRHVHDLLQGANVPVRAISGKDLTIQGAADGLAEGCDVVVSCAGASVSIHGPEKRSYQQVDPVIHLALLKEALRAGAHRFVYLSVHLMEPYVHTAYVKAHESFVQSLMLAPVTSTVIRPTGIFSAFEDLLPMARKGLLPLIGNGSARTNPIDPRDVAELMVKYLEAGPADVPCGGPEIFTRAEINRLVGKSVGKPKVWMPRMPAVLVRMEAKAIRHFHPRLGDLMEFLSYVTTMDCVVPILGQRRLSDYLKAVPAKLAVQA